jgi:hypothetical protein
LQPQSIPNPQWPPPQPPSPQPQQPAEAWQSLQPPPQLPLQPSPLDMYAKSLPISTVDSQLSQLARRILESFEALDDVRACDF